MMATISEALQIALAHHRAGQLPEAEQVYRQILEAEPEQAAARHLLGLVASQLGRYRSAIDEISQAIRIDGSQATFHANLGEAYRGLGSLHEAEACYRRALRIEPNLAAAHNNLATLLQSQGRLQDAIDSYRQAIAIQPNYADAIDCYRQGLSLQPDVERRLREAAREHRLDPARIELFDRQPLADYLRLIARVDIALDPFPFNGHTTTCDSIWMGVPVVMLEGNSYASRFGTSVLASLGLREWIAKSREEYIALATEMAADFDRLAALRARLRPRMAASELLDFVGFTRKLEQAYRAMWVKRCSAS